MNSASPTLSKLTEKALCLAPSYKFTYLWHKLRTFLQFSNNIWSYHELKLCFMFYSIKSIVIIQSDRIFEYYFKHIINAMYNQIIFELIFIQSIA